MKETNQKNKGKCEQKKKKKKKKRGKAKKKKKKKKNMNSLYASMSLRRFLNGNEGPNSWHVECRVVHIKP